jgi:hypothetical protein
MKVLSVIICAAFLFACNPSNNSPGERGVINDGMDPVDQNGALQDTGNTYTPQTDTAIGENRVDVQPRNKYNNSDSNRQ